MIKSPRYFMLLFCTVFILSACVNTRPKDFATDKTDLWNDLSTHGSNESLVKPNLTGTWVLNTDLSENPQEELKESMRQSGNSRGGKGMGGRGGGGGGEHGGKGNGGRRGDGNSRNKKKRRQDSLPQSLHALLNAPEILELNHEEPLLTFITKEGQEKVYTDFRSTSVSSSSKLNQKITIAGWENNVLIVENTISVGRFIQQFKLNPSSGNLWVNTQIITSRLPKPIQFNRVYERLKTEIEEAH